MGWINSFCSLVQQKFLAFFYLVHILDKDWQTGRKTKREHIHRQ